MAEQVLVTGGTGFIGRHLVRRLIAHGKDVRVLTRQPALGTELFGTEAEMILGDLRDGETVAKATPHGGIIYHLGGLYRFGPHRRRELREINREGTRHVLRAGALRRVEKIIHVSTAGLLYRTEGPIHPEDFQPPPLGCHYKRSKWEAECLALKAASEGLPVVIASPSCPIGPEDTGPTPTGRMIEDYLARRFVFSCRAGLNLIDVSDLAEGLMACAERGAPGRRYILGRENMALDDFLVLLQKATGIPAPQRQAPIPALLAAGLLGEFLLAAGLSHPHCSNLCLETAIFAGRLQYFELETTQRALEWAPEIPITASLDKALNWIAQREIRLPRAAALAPAAT